MKTFRKLKIKKSLEQNIVLKDYFKLFYLSCHIYHYVLLTELLVT